MTDDINQPDDAEDRSEDQQAIEASEHAADALRDGDLSHAHSLLDEASSAVERVEHDESGQTRRETAWDCYE